MKKFSKILSVALLVALVLSLGVANAFAANDASITINRDESHATGDNVNDTTEYHYYKIFDAVVPENFELTDSNIETAKTDSTGFTYTIQKEIGENANPWYAVVAGMTNYFTLTDKGDYALVELAEGKDATAATAKAMAEALKAYTKDGGGNIEPDGDIALGTAESVDKGYYLIVTTGQPNLVLATTDVTITEKNDFPTVDKEIATIDEHSEIGKDVTFTITVNVPADASLPITLTDEMTAGLTFKELTSVVDKNKANISVANPSATPAVAGYTYTAGADAQHFTIVFDAATVTANQGGTIVVTYTATVNEKAVVTTSDVNKVTLQYGNFSQWDTDETNQNKFLVTKYDGSEVVAAGGQHTPIAGAVFKLYAADQTTAINLVKVSDTEYRVATAAEVTAAGDNIKTFNADTIPTIENGAVVSDFVTVAGTPITVTGVDSDLNYYLEELKAPTGFNKVDGKKVVEVEADNSTNFTLENNKGTQLPSTGGIGTTIFYVVGGVLVLAAIILLVTKKRMSE